MSKVTNKEIARRAGVSPAAVSMAMHGQKGISAETRNRILEIAQELDYVPPAKTRLVTEGSVVLLSDALSGPTAPYVLRGLMSYAAHKNAELRLLTLPQLLENPADALSGVSLLVTLDTIKRSILDSLAARVPRILIIDGSFARRSFCNIRIDYGGAAYALTRYLAQIGHRSFIYLNQDLSADKNLICFSGFQRLILEQNLLLNPKQIIMDADSDPNVWTHLADIIRTCNTTAILCTSEAAAVEAANRLMEHGFAIPKDVSVGAITPDDSAVYPGFSFTRVCLGLKRIETELHRLAEDTLHAAADQDILLSPEPVRPGTSSCAPKFHPASKKLAIALFYKDHPTMRLARAGFLNKVQQLGYQAEVGGTPKGEIGAYVESCRQLLQQKPDGVVLWLPDREIVDMMQQAGIPVVAIHSNQTQIVRREKKVACSIAADPESIARTVANHLAKTLHDRTGVVAVTQSDDNELESGIFREFAQQMQSLCPDITVIRNHYFSRHTEQNMTLVADFIRSTPKLIASFSTCGEACITWAKAKKELDRSDIIVIGTDYTEETVELLERGEIHAFVAQPVYEEAQMSAEALDAILRGNDYPVVCQLDAPLVTAANVEKYRRLIKEVQNWYT